MSSRIRTLIAGLLGLLVIVAPVAAQFGLGGPPEGGFGRLMDRVVFGVIEEVNPVKGYLQVQVPGRGSRIVALGDRTKVTRLAATPASELKVGDEVTVSGLPTALAADQLRAQPPLGVSDLFQALQPGPPGGGPPKPPPPAPGPAAAPKPDGPPGGPPPAPRTLPRAPAAVTFTGTVKSVSPLVLDLGGGAELTVAVKPGTPLLRRAEGTAAAAAVGQEVVAVGDLNDDGYLAATEVHLGESLSLGALGAGMGMGRGSSGAAPRAPTAPPAPAPPATGQGGKRD